MSPISKNWVIIIVCTDIYHMTVTWFHSPERVKWQNSKHLGFLFLCHWTCHRKGHKKNVITKIRFSDPVWCNLCTSSKIHHSAWQSSRLFCKSYKRISPQQNNIEVMMWPRATRDFPQYNNIEVMMWPRVTRYFPQYNNIEVMMWPRATRDFPQ
jgi:hypothetical protein